MRRIWCAAALSLLAIGGASAQSPSGKFTVSNYRLESEQRASRTESYFTYRADLSNQGVARTAVTAIVTSNAPNVRVVAGQSNLHFAPVPAGGTVVSSDSFTILVDRTVPFDFSQLQWSFDGPVANAGPNQTAGIGATVRLDGGGSTNPSGVGTLVYNWAFVSRPPGTSTRLVDGSSVLASFVADAPGTYVVSVTVDNGAGIDTDVMTVSTSNSPPVANPGPSQTAAPGSVVKLNGSGSSDVDGDTLSYSWQLISMPTGSAATLTGAGTVSPTFVVDKQGIYIAQLVVNDGKTSSKPATATITTENTAPVANAGPNQAVNVGSLVQLSASGSTDVDGDHLTYEWSLISVPGNSAAKLNDLTIVTPTFTADRPGTYVAQLTVHDGKVGSKPVTVTITTNAVQAPSAGAGPGQTVLHGTLVTLDGTASDPQSLPLIFSWSLITKPAGSTAVLSASNTRNPRFVADLPGLYVVQLYCGNGYLNSPPSTVSITTINTPPVANPGTDKTVILGQIVNLNGGASRDADSDTLKYTWSLLTRPEASSAALLNATSATPSFVADMAGTYVAQLIVNDGFASSIPSTVMISANPLSITLTPDPLVLYNSPGTLTVSLSAPAGPGGLLVRFAVVDPTVAGVPSEATIPANATGVNISVVPGVLGSTLLTASAPGYRLGTSTIEVRRPSISVSLQSSTVGLTRQITGTVTLNAPAPPSGAMVSLSSNPAGIVGLSPAAVNIAGGATSATFTLTGLVEGNATVTASSAGYSSGSSPISVGRLGVIFLDQNVSLVLAASAPLQLSLASPAPLGGAVVSLVSSDPSKVTLSPATVLIPAGATVPPVQPQVTGAAAGSAVVSASSPGFTSASTTVNVRSLGTLQVPASVSVTPGGKVVFPVALSSAAPTGGITISLVSSSPSTAGLSIASLSVAAGQTAPTTQPLVVGALLGNATITASAPGYSQAVGTAVVGAALSFPTASLVVPSGTTSTVMLNLSAPAPAGGVPVTLQSNNTAVVTVPTTRTIAAGTSSVAVPVTGVVSGVATITASSTAPNVTSASLIATVQSLGNIGAPGSLEVNLGQSAPITITLPAPAPTGGLTVNLTSSDPTTAGLSATTVVIPSGQTQPSDPPKVNGLKPGAANVSVTAAGYGTAAVAVQVKATIQFTPNTINITGIKTQDLTLTLSGPAPAGGLVINLSSTNSSVATVPPTVTFAATSTTVTVPVTAVIIGSTTIRASAPNLAETTAQVNVRPLSDINLPGGINLPPGESAAFPISLVLPAANPTFIALSSSNESVAKLTPASVFVPAGQTQPTSQPRVEGLSIGEVTVTATAPGLTSATTTVSINYGLSFSPNSAQVTAGSTRNLTLVLSAPAPAGGMVVNLSSANASIAKVNPTITIPANGTSVNVVVTGVALGSTEIRANAAGIPQAIANITVVNPGVITLPATLSVPLNQSVAIPVTLSSPAPLGGVTVTLNSPNTGIATVAPATVFIAQGDTTPTTQPQVTGVNVGPVTISASAPSYTTGNSTVQVTASVNFVPASLAMTPATTKTILLSLGTSAPWAGLTVNLKSTNTAVATVQSSVGFFPDGSNVTSVAIPITAVGPGTTQIRASGINIPESVATITVVGPLTITSSSLPDGLVGTPYSFTLVSAGGLDPRTWTQTAGTLPANLALNSATGTISGTPNAVVTATPLTFKVADSSNPQQSATVNLTLTIKQPVAASITATGGTPQSAKVNTAFGLPLSATVKNANGQPVAGASVTFTAPQTGPSGSFQNGLKTATAATNAAGVATSPVFTAGSLAGQYTVTASVAGVAAPANFSLSNSTDVAASITATSGTPQQATVDTQFSALLVATVKDSSGNPVPNVTVTFAAPGTGASGTFAGGVNIATTNASGVATSAAFKANAIAGTFNVQATVGGVASPAVFALTNKPGVAATISATGGTPQSAGAGTPFAARLSATVKDNLGNPIPSVTVTFTAPAAGASGTFAGGVNTGVTNGSGVATSAVFSANLTTGSYIVNAAVAGVATPAAFSLTNMVGNPATVAATSGTPQSAPISQPFALPLVATVKDANGNPVPNVTVTFTAPATGAGGTFAGGATTAKTNASGVATSAVFTANATVGSYVVAATISGGTGPANFQLTNSAGPAASISATGGTPQTAAINTAFAGRLIATVKDAGGNAVPNVTVTFAAPASGAGGSFAGGVTTAQTNASGVATSAVFTANTTAGSYVVTGKVAGVATAANFQLTNSIGSPSQLTASGGTPQSAPINSSFAQRLAATVKDVGGNPVPNVTVTFTVPASGASGTFAGGVNTAVTNASGVATSAVFTANAKTGTYTVAATVPGGSAPANYQLTNTPGPAATIVSTGGTPQSAAISSAFAAPFVATVKDAGGNAVPNVTVTFAAPASGASGTFAGGVKTAVTNAAGVATSAVFTANAVAGSYAVAATVPGVANPANFQLTNSVGSPSQITASGGTPQSAQVSTAFAQRLAVTVKDAGGNPVPNATVTFTVPVSGAGAAFAGGVATAVTNAAGIATSALLTANATAGSYVVQATVPGGSAPATFALTNTAGAAASVTPSAGTPQSTKVATAFATRLTALVKDAGGNPVPNVTVTFAVPGSGASAAFAGGVNTAITNASGVATAAILTANNTAGTYAVTATAPGVAGGASFSLTNSAGTPASITVTSGTPQTVAINTAFPAPLVVTVKDSFGNPVPAATVTYTAPASGASGTFTGGTFTALTNLAGVATSPVFRANLVSGAYVVAATVPGVAGSASFSLTNLAGPVASIGISGGNGQSAAVGAAFASPLSAIVKDAGSNPVPGITVTFTAPASGPGAKFAGGAQTATAVTNASGVAISSALTAGDVAGAFVVTAVALGAASPATFNLTSNPGPPAVITVTSGTGQSAIVGAAFAARLVTTVKDAKGNVTPNVTVTYAAPASGASGTFSGGNTAITNAQGVATSNQFTANGAIGSYSVNATAPGVAQAAVFTLTNKPGPPAAIVINAGSPQSTTIKAAFPTRFAAKVTDAGGNPISGVTVLFNVPGNGPSGTFAGGANTATTDAAGAATAAAFTANSVAGTYSVMASVTGLSQNATFELTNNAGPAFSITATAGTPQNVAVGGSFATKLTALVKDDSGNPVPNATVTFTVPGTGASAVFAGGVNTAITSAAGVALSAAVSANTVAGSYTVLAKVTGVATGATFALTNRPGPAASIVAVSGTPQTASANSAYASPFVDKGG